MKKLLALLLACMLLCLTAAAEEVAVSPYERGAQAMYREVFASVYNTCVIEHDRASTAGLPVGIIVDEDAQQVLIVANEMAMRVIPTSAPDAMALTTGFVIYAAIFATPADDLALYRTQGSATERVPDYTAFGNELTTFLSMVEPYQLQVWSGVSRFGDDVYKDVIGRIHALRTTTQDMIDADIADELVFESFGESIILVADKQALVIQTGDRSYLFAFSDHPGFALAHAVYQVMLGGMELEDMKGYVIDIDPADAERRTVKVATPDSLQYIMQEVITCWKRVDDVL